MERTDSYKLASALHRNSVARVCPCTCTLTQKIVNKEWKIGEWEMKGKWSFRLGVSGREEARL